VRGRVFCIGLQKTGTTSVKLALRRLGYRVCGEVNGYRADMTDAERFEDALKKAPRFNAYNDFPWNIFYKEFDALLPGSKFILTIRDPDSWMKSCRRHYKHFKRPALQAIFGAPTPLESEQRFKRKLVEHERSVREYFKSRPDDLLVINLNEGGNWEKICDFLGSERPAVPFPVGFKGSRLRIRLWRVVVGVMKDLSFDMTRPIGLELYRR